MRSKLAGLILLAAVILAAGGAVSGVAEEIIRVTNVPDYSAMKKIMDGL